MHNSLVTVRKLTKVWRIGGGLGVRGKYVKALDSIDLTLPEEPSITAVVGESGSGKSTLITILLGLTRPTSGEVLFKGRDLFEILKKEPKWYWRRVQPVFQDPYGIYNPYQRIEYTFKILANNLDLTGGKTEERIRESLKAVGLIPENILKRYPHQVSGGERQRIMLARIYLAMPELILADEPITMIDASLRAVFLESLKELKRKHGVSTLIVTHSLAIAYCIADFIHVLCFGKTVEEGNIDQVINNPLHPYTKLMIECIPSPDPRERWTEELSMQELRSISRPLRGCPFQGRCPETTDKCRQYIPPLIEVTDGRKVACFKYH